MKVIFSKFAKLELEDAINFYELEYSGLGSRFKKEIEKDHIFIIAVAHQHRKPEYWINRD